MADNITKCKRCKKAAPTSKLTDLRWVLRLGDWYCSTCDPTPPEPAYRARKMYGEHR